MNQRIKPLPYNALNGLGITPIVREQKKKVIYRVITPIHCRKKKEIIGYYQHWLRHW